MSFSIYRSALFCATGVIAVAQLAAADNTASTFKPMPVLPEIEVIATTPLPSGSLKRDEIAAPVQTAESADLDRAHSLDLSEFMNRNLGSVYINAMQNNPLQPDVNYRGYTASPLLGTPQGLAVYMDGVRLNQPFGDVVSWDLIPQSAIETITLMPGSNPLFGLNALGGALSIKTKDGFAHPETSVQASYGSYARRTFEFDHGGHASNGLNWFVTGNLFRERGWRDDSPSASNQLFGKLGWRDQQTDVAITTAYAKSDLTGNGTQEQRLLANNYASVYTKPDATNNRSMLINVAITHSLSEQLSFSGNIFYRDLSTSTLNGDLNEDSLNESVYQPNANERAALNAAGYSGYPTSGETAINTPFPQWRCIANILLNSEPNEKCNGLVNRTQTEQQVLGAAGQFSMHSQWARHGNQLVDNQFTAGASVEISRADFSQSTQFGFLNPDRSVSVVSGPGAFADGTQDSENAFDARVMLSGHTHMWSGYATDTFALQDHVHLTVSGRYNHATVVNRDGLTPGGQPGSLDGDHNFDRFNPAVGITMTPTTWLNAYAGYNESNRAPSAIELGCADPDNPCKLPNSMAGDPPLKQVVAKTLELGVRSTANAAFNWNAGLFRTDNYDDILFVADQQSGFGYFKNFGVTRREGLELGVSKQLRQMKVGANYTYLNATYRSAEIVDGSANSTNDAALAGNRGFEGSIVIQSGDRIPLIPQHTFKAFVDYEINSQFSVDADMIALSSSYARGNENNLHQADGVYYLGSGRAPGYAVFNLGLDYRPSNQLKLFLQVNNALDHKYYTAAQLGPTGFRADGTFIARPFAAPVIDGERPIVNATFYSPGAPRTVAVGLRYVFN